MIAITVEIIIKVSEDQHIKMQIIIMINNWGPMSLNVLTPYQI